MSGRGSPAEGPRGREEEGGGRRAGQAGGAGGQGSCASCVCAGRRRSCEWVRVRANTHPGGARARAPGGTQARAHHDPCAHRPGLQHILLTRIAVPVQWRCRQSESRKSLHASKVLRLDEDDLVALCSKQYL